MVGKRVAICILLLACLVGPQMQPSLTAQAATSWNWDTGLQGWTVTAAGGPVWAADATPATVAGGSSFLSPPNSLNFNNGTDYTTVAGAPASTGTATSPTITISAPDNFGFNCNYQTESTTADEMTYYDRRIVRVRDGSGTVMFERAYIPPGATSPPITTLTPPYTPASFEVCSAMGTWHVHVVSLNPAWSPLTIEFVFDSVDSLFNAQAGWFIDDAALGSGGGGGGGGTGGFGPGGASRDNDNGNDGLNDLFGESWCGGGSATTTWSGFGLIAALAVLATLVLGRR